MIITRKKRIEDVEEALVAYRTLVVVGCGLCATTCETGGEKQVREMVRHLTGRGKEVLAELMVDGVCHKRLIERLARSKRARIGGAEAILVLACGSGVQTTAEVFTQPVLAGLDSLFLGQIRRHGEFRQVCLMCGDCVLDAATACCPITRCPKSLVNGPCGGAEEGQCEVLVENRCVWIEIFEASPGQDALERFKAIHAPRDHSRSVHPGYIRTGKSRK